MLYLVKEVFKKNFKFFFKVYIDKVKILKKKVRFLKGPTAKFKPQLD